MEHEQPINAYVCQYCKGSFDKLENLSKHVQKIHTVCSSGKENRICPLCGTQCIKIEGYRNHLRHIHGHNEEGQVVLFKSFNDFLVWKNELEKRNYCKYVMRDPPKKITSNDKIHIYRCDSSVGSMKEKKSGVAVRESCPAVITAIESAKTKGVKIEHWNSHVGHIIPIEDDELDAAIGSLGTAEIVLNSDQRYQYEGQSADGSIYFITETNDGSLSESFVKEVPKKSSNLFQNTKSKLSDSFSKSSSQKFSYKKDPTKKSGSFNYSLASVACMKPSAKKKVLTPPVVTTTSSVEDGVSTTVTISDVLLPTPTSSVASSEIELTTETVSNIINAETSPNSDDTLAVSKVQEVPSTLGSPSKSIPVTNTDTLANQTFEFINDGSLSGQVVLLNSLPGQKANQNLLLCPDQKFISISPAISVEKGTPKQGKASKKSQKNNALPQIVVIPTASEKENVSSVQTALNISSVQDILNISQNPTLLKTVVRNPGPSILKKAKKSLLKSPKKSLIAARKDFLGIEKNAVSPEKNPISAEEKLCLGLNPSLDVTVVDSTKSSTDSLTENVKTTDSSSLKANNVTPNTSSVSNIQNPVTTTSPLITNNPALSITKLPVSSAAQKTVSSAPKSSISPFIKNPVPSSISNIQPVNPILLNSFPPGQTFMNINNNLIPIGTPTAPLLPSSINSGFMLSSPVPPSPVTRPIRPLMTYSRFGSRLGRPPITSSTPPVRFTDKKFQYRQSNVRMANRLRARTDPSTVPLFFIPNSGSPVSPSVSFTSPLVASSGNSTLSSSVRPKGAQPIISNSFISGSVFPRPLISNNGAPVFTQLAPGTQLIPSPIISNMSTPFLTSNGQQISRPLLQNVSLLTPTGQPVPRSVLQNLSFAAPLVGQPNVASIASRPIISTTVSNTIKVQKVQLPFSKTTATGTANVTTSLSESTNVSSVVLNTEPISSAPAISIPPLASIGSHKPGSVIFESQGDVYMLEPVEETPQINNNSSVKNVLNKVSIAVPTVNGNTKGSTSDDSIFEGSKKNPFSLHKEKVIGSQSIVDTKVDGKVKSLSPRKNSDIKNGVQIKSVVQEKRHLKDDDVEILKKVKYYQMEMKYLASQAECKLLKLELAKAHLKNREITKNKADLLSDEISMKENADESIDAISAKDNVELNQNSCDENLPMDVDSSSHEIDNKTTEDQATDLQASDNIESTNQCDVESSDSYHDANVGGESRDSNHGDNICVESGDSNEVDGICAESGDSNQVDVICAESGDSNEVDGICAESEDSNQVDGICAESEDSNQVDSICAESGDSNHVDGTCAETEDSNHTNGISSKQDSICGNNSPDDFGASNNSDAIELPVKQDQSKEDLENQNSNHDSENMNCILESEGESFLETQKETCSIGNKEFQRTLENKPSNFTACDEAEINESNKQFQDINKAEILNESVENQFQNQADELMDFSEIEETFKDVTKDNQIVNDVEIEDIFQIQEAGDKQMHTSNEEKSMLNNGIDDKKHFGEDKEFYQQKDVNEQDFMELDDHNNNSFEMGKIDPPFDRSQFQETLKDLEFQYGREEPSDIYTMIRTSVLRNLYDDMKTLCEENKKLYEKLQNSSSPEDKNETEKLCS